MNALFEQVILRAKFLTKLQTPNSKLFVEENAEDNQAQQSEWKKDFSEWRKKQEDKGSIKTTSSNE